MSTVVTYGVSSSAVTYTVPPTVDEEPNAKKHRLEERRRSRGDGSKPYNPSSGKGNQGTANVNAIPYPEVALNQPLWYTSSSAPHGYYRSGMDSSALPPIEPRYNAPCPGVNLTLQGDLLARIHRGDLRVTTVRYLHTWQDTIIP